MKQLVWILALSLGLGGCAKLTGDDDDSDSTESEIFSAIENGESSSGSSNSLVNYALRGDEGEGEEGMGRGPGRRKKGPRKLRRHFHEYALKLKGEDPTITGVVGFSLRNPDEPDLDEDAEVTCQLNATISSDQTLKVAKEPSRVEVPAVVSEDGKSITVDREARGMKIIFTVHSESETPALQIGATIACGDETLDVEHDLADYLANEKRGFRFVESFGGALLRGLGANFPAGEEDGEDVLDEL